MRRFVSGILVAGVFLFCGSSQVMAQRVPAGKELNQRIQALRERLQNYQNQRNPVKAQNQAEPGEGLILEPDEPKGEIIVEELENRKDVAVTVLFHDAGNLPADVDFENVEAQDADQNEIDSKNGTGVKIVSVRAAKSDAGVEKRDSVKKSDVRQTKDTRLARYEELRQRVYLATRNARAQAVDINRQIARIN